MIGLSQMRRWRSGSASSWYSFGGVYSHLLEPVVVHSRAVHMRADDRVRPDARWPSSSATVLAVSECSGVVEGRRRYWSTSAPATQMQRRPPRMALRHRPSITRDRAADDNHRGLVPGRTRPRALPRVESRHEHRRPGAWEARDARRRAETPRCPVQKCLPDLRYGRRGQGTHKQGRSCKGQRWAP